MSAAQDKRSKIGDVIEIKTEKGLAYAQYTHEHVKPPVFGPLIRVLPGLYEARPSDLRRLVKMRERFYVFYPLDAAIQEGLVTIVGNERIPWRFRRFPLFRARGLASSLAMTLDPSKWPFPIDLSKLDEDWWLWDGEREWRAGRLSPKQQCLSLRELWDHDLLVERIANGWSPLDEV